MGWGPFNAGGGGQDGVTESVILNDSITHKHYALLIENATPTLLEVADDLEALDEVHVDIGTGKTYYIRVEDGALVLSSVEE